MDSAMVLSPATSDCSKEEIRESRVEVINLEEEEADETEEEAEEESMDELDHDITTVSQKDRPHVKRRRTKPPPRSLPARSARTRDATTPPWLKDTRRSTRQKAADLRKTGKSKYAESTPLPPAPKVVKGPTARAKVRIQIAANNKPKRDAFLLNHRELFEPLLPANNYISKLPSSSPKALAKHVAIDQQPEGIRATLRPHQMACLEFLVGMYNNCMSAIVGDEMGLGKTLQTLSLIQYLEENHPTAGVARPYLVVCPLSVLETWCDEAKKWTPKLKMLRFHGNVAERVSIKQSALGRADSANFDIMVTTYEAFAAEQTWFQQSFVWRYVICDEGHRLKNDKTLHAQALQGLSAEHRLLLTGTPLQNDMRELWSLLHWLYPDVFPVQTAIKFEEAFNLSKGQANKDFMGHARRLLELVMIRRMKNDPGINLNIPPKTEVLLYLPLTPFQRFWYQRVLTKLPNQTIQDLFGNSKQKEEAVLKEEKSEDKGMVKVDTDEPSNEFAIESRAMIQQAIAYEEKADKDDKDVGAYKRLQNLVMQLRKICIHPYQIKGASPEPYLLGDHLIHASSKFIILSKMIDELVIGQRKKVIIFSGFTMTLDYVEDLLLTKGSAGYQAPFHHVRFDGGTSRARRNLQVRLFNDPASDYRVMLISTRAGGLGLNLAAACSDIIFLDEDWNPQVLVQAESRVHRIGQTKPVTIYKLCTQGTVEEQMMGRIRKKLYLAAKITDSMQDLHTNSSRKRKRVSEVEDSGIANDDEPQVAMSQLKSLIRRGAETLTHPEIDVAEMTSWSLATILEKCKDKPADPHNKDEPIAAADIAAPTVDETTEEAWLAKMERVECAVFDGVKYARQKEAEAAVPVEIRREDRRIGKNTTVMIDGYAVDKKTVNNAKWEAVATFAGKDPRLAEPVREKAKPIEHQDHCQVCMDGREMELCARCPRAYHKSCLPPDSSVGFSGLNCPQHQCADCGHNTAAAGGLMYRCRWCEKGHCEDCLDWTKARLLGESIPEFEVLGFENKKNAWFVECQGCISEFETNPPWKTMIMKMKVDAEQQYEAWSRAPEAVEEVLKQEIPVPLEVKKIEASKAKTPKEKTPKEKTLEMKEEAKSAGSKQLKLNFTAPRPKSAVLVPSTAAPAFPQPQHQGENTVPLQHSAPRDASGKSASSPRASATSMKNDPSSQHYSPKDSLSKFCSPHVPISSKDDAAAKELEHQHTSKRKRASDSASRKSHAPGGEELKMLGDFAKRAKTNHSLSGDQAGTDGGRELDMLGAFARRGMVSTRVPRLASGSSEADAIELD